MVFLEPKIRFCCGGGLLKFGASIEDVQEVMGWVKWQGGGGGYIWKFAQAHFFEKYWWTLFSGEYILRN